MSTTTRPAASVGEICQQLEGAAPEALHQLLEAVERGEPVRRIELFCSATTFELAELAALTIAGRWTVAGALDCAPVRVEAVLEDGRPGVIVRVGAAG